MPKGTLKINGGYKYKGNVFRQIITYQALVNHDIPMDALGQILSFFF